MRTLALAMVLVSAVGCGADGDDDGAAGAHQLCVDKTNQLRATVGKPAVTRSAALEDFADAGAAYDHTRQPHDHFRATSGGGLAFAENECPHWDLGFGGGDELALMAACIDAFWSEGPGGGHYDNMTGDHGSLGCGLHHDGPDYTIIQDFGR